mmetsp:Transcript_14137/g.23076  ORF Transcript_14137/g.23076 Transcript_14137/m.23076 type:complete len:81 (-) Transcript_14137:193-435(-)
MQCVTRIRTDVTDASDDCFAANPHLNLTLRIYYCSGSKRPLLSLSRVCFAFMSFSTSGRFKYRQKDVPGPRYDHLKAFQR